MTPSLLVRPRAQAGRVLAEPLGQADAVAVAQLVMVPAQVASLARPQAARRPRNSVSRAARTSGWGHGRTRTVPDRSTGSPARRGRTEWRCRPRRPRSEHTGWAPGLRPLGRRGRTRPKSGARSQDKAWWPGSPRTSGTARDQAASSCCGRCLARPLACPRVPPIHAGPDAVHLPGRLGPLVALNPDGATRADGRRGGDVSSSPGREEQFRVGVLTCCAGTPISQVRHPSAGCAHGHRLTSASLGRYPGDCAPCSRMPARRGRPRADESAELAPRPLAV
jgi:hypothetical protein